MLMSMMGGNAGGQAQGAFAGNGIGYEEMRGLISETVTALLPGVQQALPQQASSNDELVNKLIEQNEKLMQKLAEQPKESKSNDDKVIQKLVENQELLMKKMAEQPVDRVVEREVAVANASDETLKQMLDSIKKTDSVN